MRTVVERYDARVSKGDFQHDEAQVAVAVRLDALAVQIEEAGRRPSGWGRLFGSGRGVDDVKGLYIVGDVGRGKTMLMDLFFETVSVEPKRRVHFHAFMADVHARVHDWRQASRRGLAKGHEPIGAVAEALAAEAHLLCFDEFSVTDIADAMILGRLFTALLALKVTVVATSNVAPVDLYRDGLNRTSFLPFVAMLEERLEVLRLDASQDFRFAHLNQAPTWFSPLDDAATATLDHVFSTLTGGAEGRAVSLPLFGRTVRVPHAAGDVARFSFASLCEAPLGAADYLVIAKAYGTVLIDGIRTIRVGERNLAKRFVTMIDTFYDERVKVIASAEAEPEDLYEGEDGHETFEFHRTVSRLREMRSTVYLALPHGHGRVSGNSEGLVET